MLATTNRRYFGAFSAALTGVGVALGLAACGHTAVLKHDRLSVALLEYRLRPDHVVATAGALHITAVNAGALTHDLVLTRPHPTTTVTHTPTGAVTVTTAVAARTPDLAPGQSTTLTVTLAPGRYRMASSVGADQALGEQGTLTVTSK